MKTRRKVYRFSPLAITTVIALIFSLTSCSAVKIVPTALKAGKAVKGVSSALKAGKAAETVVDLAKVYPNLRTASELYPLAKNAPEFYPALRNAPELYPAIRKAPVIHKLDISQQIHSKPQVGVSLPVNIEEYANVYKKLPSEKQTLYLNHFNTELISAHNVNKIGSFDDFMSLTKNSNDSVVILVGHNENGVFVFTNGEKVPLRNLENRLIAENKMGVFISCESNKYLTFPNMVGLDHRIKYDEAYKMSQKIAEYLNKQSANIEMRSPQKIESQIRKIRFEQNVAINSRRAGIVLITLATAPSPKRDSNLKEKSFLILPVQKRLQVNSFSKQYWDQYIKNVRRN